MRTILLTALLATACAADPADDVPPDDGPVTIVGTWRRLPNPLLDPPPEEDRSVYRFLDDKTFEATWSDGAGDGTWLLYGTPEHRYLRMIWSDGLWEEFDVALTRDRLLLWALIPEGNVDGPVGNWSGEYYYGDGRGIRLRYEIEDDGTFRLYDSRYGLTDGTWSELGQSIEFTIPGAGSHYIDRLDEDGIGTLTERID